MRVRNSVKYATQKYCYHSDSRYAPNVNVYTGGLYASQKSITDVSTPNFHQRIRSGELILNPVTVTRRRTESSGASVFFSYPRQGYTVEYSGDLIGLFERNPSPESIGINEASRARALAIIMAYGNIQKDKLYTGVIAGELSETIRTIRSPMKALVKHLNDFVLKRKQIYKRFGLYYLPSEKRSSAYWKKRNRSAEKAVYSTWLEYRYGIRPLVFDISTAMKQADIIRKRTSDRRCARGHIQTSDIVAKGGGRFQCLSMDAEAFWDAVYNCRADAGVYFRAAHGLDDTISRTLGLGADSILSTAWELVPYSFVVDWALGIGDWINMHSIPPSVTVEGRYATTLEVQTKVTVGNLTTREAEYPFKPRTDHIGSQRMFWWQYQRVVNQSLPTLPIPRIPWSGVTRACDAITLLLQVVRR